MDTIVPDISTLNADQREVYEACVNSTESVFCTGQGGTGKTYLLSCIVATLKARCIENPQSVAVTASTGSAAFLIRGMTLHRFASTGIDDSSPETMLRLARRGQGIPNWTNVDVLIIDEISMLSARFFDNLSTVAQNIRRDLFPFGGVRLLMFGDFLQLPPVSRSGQRVRRIFESETWYNLDLQIMELRISMRQQDPILSAVLDRVRLGVCRDSTVAYFQRFDREITYNDGIEATRLYARKNRVAAYNADRLDRIDNPEIEFHSKDIGMEDTLMSCPAEKKLVLKVGAQVMLIRNISDKLVNGSIGVIKSFHTTIGNEIPIPTIEFICADGTFETVSINTVEWRTETPDGHLISLRSQLPLILAWAITIHKSQGRTIPRVYVDMAGIFEKGQAYVALSRCNDVESMQVVNFTKDCVMADVPSIDFHCLTRARENAHRISVRGINENLPEYFEGNDPPSYDEASSATPVASATDERWGLPTADTMLMLGHLSLDDMFPPSNPD